MALSDARLGEALCPAEPHVGAWVANRLPPAKRATLERMVEFADAWNHWQTGIGEKHDLTGVIVTPDRAVRRDKARPSPPDAGES